MQLSQAPWEFLIVCRDARVQQTLVDAIHASGASAHAMSDTASALAYIAGRKLDGIFIDIRVHGALSLVGSLRRGNSNRYSAVFACAGEDEDISRLLNAGVNFVLHRPVDPVEVATVLRNARFMMLAERQRYVRHRLSLQVVLTADHRERRAVTRDISRGGMAVRCQESLKPGSPIQFVLELPSLEPLVGRGEVCWSNDRVMGIRFYMMEEAVRNVLWQWIEQRSQQARA